MLQKKGPSTDFQQIFDQFVAYNNLNMFFFYTEMIISKQNEHVIGFTNTRVFFFHLLLLNFFFYELKSLNYVLYIYTRIYDLKIVKHVLNI